MFAAFLCEEHRRAPVPEMMSQDCWKEVLAMAHVPVILVTKETGPRYKTSFKKKKDTTFWELSLNHSQQDSRGVWN